MGTTRKCHIESHTHRTDKSVQVGAGKIKWGTWSYDEPEMNRPREKKSVSTSQKKIKIKTSITNRKEKKVPIKEHQGSITRATKLKRKCQLRSGRFVATAIFTALFGVGLTPVKLAAASIWVDCGGVFEDYKSIIGCFGALDSNRHIIYKNGIMDSPGENFSIRMHNWTQCFMRMDLEQPPSPGYYQCGSVVREPNNQTKYAFWTSFRITDPVDEKIQMNLTKRNTTKNVEAHNVPMAARSPKSPNERQLLSGTSILLKLTTAGVSFMVFVTIARFARKKLCKDQLTPPRSNLDLNKTSKYYSNDLEITIPPAMDLIPTDSLSRWIRKKETVTSDPQPSCSCIQGPIIL